MVRITYYYSLAIPSVPSTDICLCVCVCVSAQLGVIHCRFRLFFFFISLFMINSSWHPTPDTPNNSSIAMCRNDLWWSFRFSIFRVISYFFIWQSKFIAQLFSPKKANELTNYCSGSSNRHSIESANGLNKEPANESQKMYTIVDGEKNEKEEEEKNEIKPWNWYSMN